MIVIREEIIRRCINNDRRAQTELYNILEPKMYAVINKLSRSTIDSDMIISLTMHKIFKCIAQFEFNGSFFAWCNTIARHTVSDFYRRKRHNLISLDQYTDIDPNLGIDYIQSMMLNEPCENTALGELIITDSLKLIKKLLTSKEYRIFMLYYEGYTHKEIGERLSISHSTSKLYLHEARKKIINNKTIKKLKH